MDRQGSDRWRCEMGHSKQRKLSPVMNILDSKICTFSIWIRQVRKKGLGQITKGLENQSVELGLHFGTVGHYNMFLNRAVMMGWEREDAWLQNEGWVFRSEIGSKETSEKGSYCYLLRNKWQGPVLGQWQTGKKRWRTQVIFRKWALEVLETDQMTHL